MVLLAMFVVAVPTASAQTPLSDQYQTDESVPVAGSGVPVAGSEVPVGVPAGEDIRAGAGSGPAAQLGREVAVDVKNASPASTDALPFTGEQIALIALLGAGLVALGVAGVATTRRRGSLTAS